MPCAHQSPLIHSYNNEQNINVTVSNNNTNFNLSFHPPNPTVNPFMPRGVLGTRNALTQKAFRYLQTVFYSTQQEEKIGKYSSVHRGSFSSGGHLKITNSGNRLTWPVVRPEYGTVGINGLSRKVSVYIVQELCESRGGRPGPSVLTSLLASVDVKIYITMLRHWSQFVPNMSSDIRGH